jgi:hypothetical protein
MFDLLIDKKKKKMSSMNKICEKKPTTAHSQNILHVDVLYNIKRKKYIKIAASGNELYIF